MIIGGRGIAIASPATNRRIVNSVPIGRRGLGFGIKQSFLPAARVLAGLSVPLIALTHGWRYAFWLGRALSIAVLAAMAMRFFSVRGGQRHPLVLPDAGVSDGAGNGYWNSRHHWSRRRHPRSSCPRRDRRDGVVCCGVGGLGVRGSCGGARDAGCIPSPRTQHRAERHGRIALRRPDIRAALPYVREFTEPSSTALLMWDFQVGLAGRALHLDPLLAASDRLLAAADAAGIPVIWSRHTLPPLESTTLGMQLFQARKQGVASARELKPFMQPGSPEREFLTEVSPRPHDTVIDKSTPSFFVGSALQQRLFAAGTRSVVLAGVATEIGVDLTAKHALALGYVPVVIEDAVGSYTDEQQEIGLAALRTWIPVLTSAEIISVWQHKGTESP